MSAPAPETLLRIYRVRERVGLSRATIYRMVARGEFPRPVRIGRQAVAWPSSAIASWIESRRSAAEVLR